MSIEEHGAESVGDVRVSAFSGDGVVELEVDGRTVRLTCLDADRLATLLTRARVMARMEDMRE